MSDESSGTWPEQDAVWDWCAKHGIEAEHKQKLELSENATKFRIELQHELEDTKEYWRNDMGIRDYEIGRLREALEKIMAKLKTRWSHAENDVYMIARNALGCKGCGSPLDREKYCEHCGHDPGVCMDCDIGRLREALKEIIEDECPMCIAADIARDALAGGQGEQETRCGTCDYWVPCDDGTGMGDCVNQHCVYFTTGTHDKVAVDHKCREWRPRRRIKRDTETS